MGDLERELARRNEVQDAERQSREKIASGWQVVTFLLGTFAITAFVIVTLAR
jgi:hypothetical protein